MTWGSWPFWVLVVVWHRLHDAPVCREKLGTAWADGTSSDADNPTKIAIRFGQNSGMRENAVMTASSY